MKHKNKKLLILGISLLALFIIWTVLICFVDIQQIGPEESSIGFANLNAYIHKLTGVNMLLYTITDWLSIIPITVMAGFTILGLLQLIKRKSPLKVDYSILALGVFYIILIMTYAFFEIVVINYRPIYINGCLEASYPSSTTMLVMCVMPTAAIELNKRIKSVVFRRSITIAITLFTLFIVVGRFVSGVHWITDIIGGALFSSGMVLIYSFAINKWSTNKKSS